MGRNKKLEGRRRARCAVAVNPQRHEQTPQKARAVMLNVRASGQTAAVTSGPEGGWEESHDALPSLPGQLPRAGF